MNSDFPRAFFPSLRLFISVSMAVVLFAAPLTGQQRNPPAKPPARPDPTFDTLLAADSYELYGEVRNVGQLLSTGGAGEIVDPIAKLADPPQEFKSIIKFLKTNAEPLSTARLMFAAWPARNDIPTAFVAIEFANPEEAAKFAPKLDTFLPTVLPPVPVVPEEKPSGPGPATAIVRGESSASPNKNVTPAAPAASPQKPEERLPFVISHSGNLVFISDKAFKFEKLHPASGKPLAEDQNFRIARDRFSSESIFLFFNVALEERSRPKAPPKEVVSEAEAEQARKEEQARIDAEADAQADAARKAAEAAATPPEPPVIVENPNRQARAVLMAGPQPSPTPTPTKEEQVQAIASSNIGHMLDSIGLGEPQWPEAVGVAIALDNNEYVIRAILVESPSAKRLPLPFLPQLISGPPYAAEASSVLPDDTEVFVSISVDFAQTYGGMRKQAEIRAKETARQIPTSAKEEAEPLDPFLAFEKKAGFKISEDLLPAIGNEIAVAGSLTALGGMGGGPFNIQPPRSKKASTADGEKDQEKKGSVLPMLLIAVKDREAARKLMPHVLDGLGVGEANLIAQVEKREDTELVNYGGFFAYAFVGNFVVISDSATVRKSIDAYLNHHTLASNTAFRNSSRWQPKQILGDIYVSPALMEGYQEEVRKQAPTMDPTMRDFLMRLTTTSEAITYALSNDGLGALHEIHLPKNLIITMVAGISSATKTMGPETNEMIAMSSLGMLNSAESSYQATAGNGKYGTLDQLIEQKLVTKDIFEKYGYKLDVRVSGDQFEAVTTPVEYGKTGKRSFFVDQSGVIRGDDHGGGAATIADKPVEP